ncbi:MAG: hypothetical protein GW748_02670 [Alphaproteobacteria bacterium]|nr:hypothetical protein [Alphaproteobacteria bacterium]NCQ66631.1 hypothetical protein [Alphaproteobacteria bacterium]NCT06983.1 hypothetical protein [Alphaproteobacteria bacterium]
MTQFKKTLREVRDENFFKEPEEIPTLGDMTLSSYEQDELLGELLGNQLRRRAMSTYAPKPHWALFL